MISDLQAIKLLPAALLAAFTHRVAAPLIAYVVGKRHAEVHAAYPVFEPGDTGAVVKSWSGLFSLVKFIVTLQFVKLRDRTLTVLCIVEMCAITIALTTLTILLAHFLGPAVSALQQVFVELIALLHW